MAKDHIFGCGRKDVPKCRMTPLKRNIQIWVSTSYFIHFTAKLDTDSVSRYIYALVLPVAVLAGHVSQAVIMVIVY